METYLDLGLGYGAFKGKQQEKESSRCVGNVSCFYFRLVIFCPNRQEKMCSLAVTHKQTPISTRESRGPSSEKGVNKHYFWGNAHLA